MTAPTFMKKKRKRSKIRQVREIIDRTAQSLEKAGIGQNRCVIRLGGQRPERLHQKRKHLPKV